LFALFSGLYIIITFTGESTSCGAAGAGAVEDVHETVHTSPQDAL